MAEEGTSGRDSGLSVINILLVDDTPAKLLTYEAILAGLGANLLKATSAAEAFQILLKTEVALVLADVMMPAMDGFEFAKMLREHPRFQHIPLIFISAALWSEVDLLKGYGTGAVDYVTAPVIPELLRAKVKVFVELHRLRNDLETRVQQRTAELAQSEERYRSLVEHANDIVATLDLDFRFTWVNPAVERILGYAPSEIIGTALRDYVPEDQLAMHQAMLQRKLGGEASTQYEMQLLGKDRRQRFTLEVNSKLMVDVHGNPVGIHSISRDITDRKEAEARQSVLIRELQHRTKNLLSVVQSIVSNTLARTPSSSAAKEAIIGRLHALSHAQDFVASGKGGGVPLRSLVEAELAGFNAQYSAQGIPVVLGPAFAQQFALVLHELATNAAKYGALSVPQGKLSIAWHVDGEDKPCLVFSWTERGGPLVKPPGESGFGMELISIALNGRPKLVYKAHGLEFVVRVPMAEVMHSTP